MLFKDIQQGYTVHILDKQDMKYIQGKVTGNTFPRMETINGKAQMVVDVLGSKKAVPWDDFI